MENIASVATQNGGTAKYNYTDEIYSIRINDKKEGILIPANVITSLEIEETMFSLLPTFKLKIDDKGSFFTGFNIKNGDVLYITITPNIDPNKDEPKPYIEGEYCVQSIDCLPDLASGYYSYTIIGIYNAQNYLNQIATYPKSTLVSLVTRDEKTSDAAIHEVLDETPLKLITECSFADSSLWVNCNLTRAQFIEKIVDHAWVSEDDAPLLYTDKFGQTFYTSIKTLSEQKPLAKFKHIKYYYEHGSEDPQKPMLYGDVDFLNAAGPILNQGGYKVKETYYTPYNWTDLTDKDIEFADINFTDMITDILLSTQDLSVSDILIGELLDNITKGKYRIINYQHDEPYLATRSNKAASQIENVSKNVNCGMHFKDYHSHYDLAPAHNEMIRRGFFQNFVNLFVDVHRQPKTFMENICRPTIADKIHIDFSNEDGMDKIHSGNYIICGIKHCFMANHSYTMQVKAVTDGTFGKGAFEEELEKSKS